MRHRGRSARPVAAWCCCPRCWHRRRLPARCCRCRSEPDPCRSAGQSRRHELPSRRRGRDRPRFRYGTSCGAACIQLQSAPAPSLRCSTARWIPGPRVTQATPSGPLPRDGPCPGMGGRERRGTTSPSRNTSRADCADRTSPRRETPDDPRGERSSRRPEPPLPAAPAAPPRQRQTERRLLSAPRGLFPGPGRLRRRARQPGPHRVQRHVPDQLEVKRLPLRQDRLEASMEERPHPAVPPLNASV